MDSNSRDNPILLLDCGSKLFDQLCIELKRQNIPFICRSLSPIRYCQDISAPRIRSISDVMDFNFSGIILSGSSRYHPNLTGAPFFPPGMLDFSKQNKIPILGLCYGMQLIAATFDGIINKNPKVDPMQMIHECKILKDSPLFQGLPEAFSVFLYHKHFVQELPKGFELIAQGYSIEKKFLTSPHIGIQYISLKKDIHFFGLQFHPESNKTPEYVRNAIFQNFWNLCNQFN